jgi:hypothetical protein
MAFFNGVSLNLRMRTYRIFLLERVKRQLANVLLSLSASLSLFWVPDCYKKGYKGYLVM